MNSTNNKNLLLEKYLEEIIKVNEYINLTRITNFEQGKIIHIEDSLAILDKLNSAPDGLYGDLGSGCGFPGVPLGVCSERQTILVDSVKKKMSAVDKILQQLNIKNISVNGNRIEDLVKEYKNKFAVITARALSSTSAILELASPILQKDGLLICMKANMEQEELDASKIAADICGMKLIDDSQYTIGNGDIKRRSLTYKKVRDPKIKLPRKIGMAQKKPLGY
jgi:16S rRNA (guanine527-N7)-methyltransferase